MGRAARSEQYGSGRKNRKREFVEVFVKKQIPGAEITGHKQMPQGKAKEKQGNVPKYDADFLFAEHRPKNAENHKEDQCAQEIVVHFKLEC